jgi:hypothetical protein
MSNRAAARRICAVLRHRRRGSCQRISRTLFVPTLLSLLVIGCGGSGDSPASRSSVASESTTSSASASSSSSGTSSSSTSSSSASSSSASSSSASSSSASSVSPQPLAIVSTTLPSGQVGAGYHLALAAAGGTAPYSWTLASGALPDGLALDAASGEITGTPTVAVSAVPLTFSVTDSTQPAQSASATLPLTIAAAASPPPPPPPQVSRVAVSPVQAALAAGQSLGLTATTDDPAGVTWSIAPKGGAFSSASSPSGGSVTLTAPTIGGVYTVTATSVSDPSRSSSLTVAVTDLPGIFTYRDDVARDGVNGHEYALTPATVSSSSFGKLFSCPVDGAIYAQPLWVAQLNVSGTARNVVFVATEHDSLYAFDADAADCEPLWSVSLIDAAHGGGAGETSVPAGTTGFLVGKGHGNMAPEVGVTGTPVIDPATGTLFVVSKSTTGSAFYQRLHAIDLATGREKGTPATIAATYPGSGDGSTTVTFDPRQENQRAGLALVNGTVYIAWSSHEDATPFYGWVIGYTFDGTRFAQTAVLNVAPDAGEGGIWMSGGAPAADAAGHLYLITGNAHFDASSATAPNRDYGDSFLQLSGALSVLQYFTPSDQATDNANDYDFGAGGAAVLADLPAGAPITHIAIGGGKDGMLYVLNRDALGGEGDSGAWQKLSVGGRIFSTAAFWNDTIFLAPQNQPLTAYGLNASTGRFALAATASTPIAFPGGSSPAVSASGASNGIVWVLDSSACTLRSTTCGPAVLHAYDATNIATELWNSATASGDQAGNAVKFVVPTVANGRVYVATRGNNTGGAYGSTSISGSLDVYGLKSH